MLIILLHYSHGFACVTCECVPSFTIWCFIHLQQVCRILQSPVNPPSRHTLSVCLTSAIACPLLLFMINGLSVPYCCLQPCPSCVCREPEALQLLIQLYVERNYMLWKIPEVCSLSDHVRVDGEIYTEIDIVMLRVHATYILLFTCMHLCTCWQVLTWLETNARAVAQKYKATDPTFAEHKQRWEMCMYVHDSVYNYVWAYFSLCCARHPMRFSSTCVSLVSSGTGWTQDMYLSVPPYSVLWLVVAVVQHIQSCVCQPGIP